MTRYRKWRDPRTGTFWVIEESRARNALAFCTALTPLAVACVYAWVIH